MSPLVYIWSDETAQDLAEYALLLALIALLAIVAIELTGESIGGMWDSAFSSLASALGGGG